MTRRIRTLTLVALCALPRLASALSTTCTTGPNGVALVTHVPSAGDFVFQSSNANLAIPMDIDEATGAVTVHRDGLPTVNVGTQGGPVAVHLEGGPVTGTLDAAGGMFLKDFGVDTVFGGSVSLPTTPNLSTGSQVTTLNDDDFPTEGVALDFTTGLVVVSGADIILDAPIVSEPVISGLRLTCTLNPIPDRSALPRGSALKGVKGKVTGDTLTLKGVLSTGRPVIDVKTQDLVVRLAGAGGDVVYLLARIPAASASVRPAARGPRAVSVLAGLADGNTEPSNVKATLKGSKKRAAFSLKLGGLDLSGVDGNITARVSVGGTEASVPLVAAAGKLKTAR